MVKKIVDYRHDKTIHHGQLKDWEKSDIQRLLRKMVIEEYLREDLIFANDIPSAYIYLGVKVSKIMTEDIVIQFSIVSKEKKAVASVSSGVSDAIDTNKQARPELRRIKERCYEDLLDLCRTIAAARNYTMASVMNMQALKAMAETLPETEADMCALPHVTKANFEKYGAKMLEITRNYAAEKLCLLMDLEEEHASSSFKPASSKLPSSSWNNNNVDDDDDDWEHAAGSQGAHSSSSGSYRGGKRKRVFRNNGSKRQKKNTGNYNKSGEHNKSTSSKRGKTTKSTTSGGWLGKQKAGTTKRNSKSNSSTATFQLMPIPGSK